VTVEPLALRPPIATAHRIADRQAAPSLPRYGTRYHKRRRLPVIAERLEALLDLHMVGGWRLMGRKVWTSYAHHAYLLALHCQTVTTASRSLNMRVINCRWWSLVESAIDGANV
jgi:acyl-CoA dehydrogenase